MIDFVTPYGEILHAIPAEPRRDVVCIRTGALEPVYDSYLRYYDPHIVLRYTDVHSYLAEKTDAPAAAILTLREIAPALWERLYTLTEEEIRTHTENVRRLLLELITHMERHSSRPVFFLFFEESPVFPAANTVTAADIAAELNGYVRTIVRSTRIVDTPRIAAEIGTASFLELRSLYRFGCPFSRTGCNALAYYTAEALRLPPPKKCIVCDCDGVLWGGVLADDGMDGIELSGDFSGRAYRDFQRELARLVREGILLCLCSKNDESTLFEVLRTHPDMILREEHIAAARIGYENKADAIRSLAAELNLSAGDMMFFDDSEYEIGLVQAELPEVLCVRMDAHRPGEYAALLRGMDCFDKASVTDEDRRRTGQYKAAAKRQTAFSETADLDAYHAGLKTELTIRPAVPFDLPRIAQLAARTNQCNLSNTHPNPAKIREIAEDAGRVLLALMASDIYGDMGLVGAAVLALHPPRAVITNFWLSCRVFHRGFEDAMLDELRKTAQAAGCSALSGVYVPTEKNRLFAEFYERNGVPLYE